MKEDNESTHWNCCLWFLLHRLWGHSPAVSERVVTLCAALFHLVESGSTVLERIWCCTASPQHQGNWSGLWT